MQGVERTVCVKVKQVPVQCWNTCDTNMIKYFFFFFLLWVQCQSSCSPCKHPTLSFSVDEMLRGGCLLWLAGDADWRQNRYKCIEFHKPYNRTLWGHFVWLISRINFVLYSCCLLGLLWRQYRDVSAIRSTPHVLNKVWVQEQNRRQYKTFARLCS